MQRIGITSFFLAALLLTSFAIAQTGDWQAVQQLPEGTRLKIRLKRGRTFGHCVFLDATDDVLKCDYPGPMPVPGQYRRDNIKAVYLVHNARAIGLGIGAVSGVIIGAATTSGPPAARELFAVIDAGLLGGIGYFFGMVADPFFHGRTVYRSPHSGKDHNRKNAPNRDTNSQQGPSDCLRDGVTLRCVSP